jgi:sulfite exporter TauE/SafE
MNTTLQFGFIAAWVAGTLGSTHCLTMCGGIATLAGSRAGSARMSRVLAFNLGRLGSYALAGALVGGLGWRMGTLIGNAASWDGMLRMMMGLVMAAIGLHVAMGWSGLRRLERIGVPLWRRIGPLARRLDPRHSPVQALAFGALWGWIPCGLVYTALLTALVSGSASAGAGMMLAFGVGTLPAMLSLGLVGQRLRHMLARHDMRRTFGVMVIGLGIWTAIGPLAMPYLGHPPHVVSSTAAPDAHQIGIHCHFGHCMESGQIEERHLPPIHGD